MPDDSSLYDYKMRFARLLQRQEKSQRLSYAHQVAKEVIGKENALKYTSYVMQIADEWPLDKEVIAEVDRLDAIPKPREEWLNEVWSRATDKMAEQKDRNQALRIYGEAMKWLGDHDEPTESNQHLSNLHNMIDALKNPAKT